MYIFVYNKNTLCIYTFVNNNDYLLFVYSTSGNIVTVEETLTYILDTPRHMYIICMCLVKVNAAFTQTSMRVRRIKMAFMTWQSSVLFFKH